MKKSIAIAAMLTAALFALSPAQAASYQDRAMATGAVFGGTTGAAIGSNSNQAVEGAIFGAVLGTIAGIIIADQHRPAPVVYTHHRPVVKRHVYSHQRPAVKRHAYKHQRRVHRVAEQRAHHRQNRYVAQGYGHHRSGTRRSDYRAAKRHDYRNPVNRHGRSEQSGRRSHRGDNDS
jgi:hypothetical protein